MSKIKIEKNFKVKVLQLLDNHGYQKKEETFYKEVEGARKWFFSISLWSTKPYSVSSLAGCEYLDASSEILTIVKKPDESLENKLKVSFAAQVDKFSDEKSIIKINSEDDVLLAAEIFVEKLKSFENNFLEPRLNQKTIVDDFFKPIVKWPTGDVVKCCVTIVSFGLLSNDFDLSRKGIKRAYEILDRPNYNQHERWIIDKLNDDLEDFLSSKVE